MAAARAVAKSAPSSPSRRGRSRLACAAALTLVGLLQGCGPAPDELRLLAQPGPWPWLSDLIVHEDRLWLASSVKYEEHASADLYSYDPGGGGLRYEWHLFSQGVGHPTNAGGLLYWPHADSRFTLGVGHFSVTDGESWRLGVIDTSEVLHMHALATLGAELVAASAARQPLIQASADGGRSWRRVLGEPSESGPVRPILRLASAGRRLFGYHVDTLRPPVRGSVVEVRDAALVPVGGWPASREVLALEPFRDRVFAVVDEGDVRALWSTDGRDVRRHGEGPRGAPLRDLAAEGETALWALSVAPDGGTVWRSEDLVRWTPQARLRGGRPLDLELLRGAPYVGGRGGDGRGALWGPPLEARAEAASAGSIGVPRTALLAAPGPALDWDAERVALARALTRPESYALEGRALRDRVLRLARSDPPAGFFTQQLAATFPELRVPMLAGRLEISAPQLGRWILFWGMALSGRGPVPLEWVRARFSAPPNAREKYFEEVLGALAAVTATRQRDTETIEALFEHLAREEEPDWLRGDVVGALRAVTGERFGYDLAAWRAWWSEAKYAWPKP